MRIGLTISRLARGGAEQQLMRLARGLEARGHQVEVLCYGGGSELDASLHAANVPVRTGSAQGWIGKHRAFRAWLARFQPDVVHAFMKRASSLAILARGRNHPCAVLASDFSTATYNRRNPELWAALPLFAFADAVVTQTHINQRSLKLLAPWLRGRTHVVRNGLDTRHFVPPMTKSQGAFRFCVVGSVYKVKNPVGVVEAVAELRRRGRDGFVVQWYGRLGLGGDGQPSRDYMESRRRIDDDGLHSWLRFHGETRDILSAYQASDALIHVSHQEGFPNAVVEGMACGLPIIGSQVSDLPLVVAEADNGRIVDSRDPIALADAMEWMLDLDAQSRLEMGRRSRELAVRWFNQERFVDEYLALYQRMLRRRAGGTADRESPA